jgi:DsbC/DsbD-like thiol-disulfide interchange protein
VSALKNIFALLLFLAASAQPSEAQLYQGRKLVEASLVADTTSIVPGKPFRLGLHLKIAPGWHVYWKNPGDSGIATDPGWDLPESFKIGSLQWPLPRRITEPGNIEVYAYKNEMLLVAEVVPPQNLDGESITFRAKPKWLVCEQICIPGAAELELILPVSREAAPANAGLFAKFAAQLPSTSLPPFGLAWAHTATGWNLSVTGVEDAGRADFYPYANDTAPIGHTAPVQIVDGAADLAVPVEKSPPVAGVVVLENGERRGWIVSSEQNVSPQVAPEKTAATGLLRYLLLGLIGGFILNLMPCVLPVISLKIFGFMRQAGDSRAQILKHGLAFAAGIFVWFLGLAAVIVALKSFWCLRNRATRPRLAGRRGSGKPWRTDRIVRPRRPCHLARHAVHRALPRHCAGLRFQSKRTCHLRHVRRGRHRHGPALCVALGATWLDEIFAQARRMDGTPQAIHGVPAHRHVALAALCHRTATRHRRDHLGERSLSFPRTRRLALWRISRTALVRSRENLSCCRHRPLAFGRARILRR